MRKHFAETLIAFLFLLSISVWFGSFPIPMSSPSVYQRVNANVLVRDAASFEGENISTAVTIDSLTHSSVLQSVYMTNEGFRIQCPVSLGILHPGDQAVIRGVSRISSSSVVDVSELEVIDPSVSLIRSIPGLLLFVLLFFKAYRFDFKNLEFVSRGESSA